jgi:tetratricopeptide (TPR) repeat protein
LTRSIAQQIEAKLEIQQASLSAHQVDPATYENYLKGRYYFNQRTPDTVNKSIASFTQAIAGDPKFALAYSGLADAYAWLGYRGAYPSKEALSQAKAAAWKAIELDATLADPHISLAFIAETYEWDWATSEREYKRAIELNPNDSRAHHFYASYLTYIGQFDEGIAEEKRARELDPLSLPVNNALAGRLLAAGRSREALEQARATSELDANFAPVHQTLGWIYLKNGKAEDGVQEFRRALQLSGSNDMYLRSDLAFACAVSGKRDEAEKALADFKSLHAQGLAPPGLLRLSTEHWVKRTRLSPGWKRRIRSVTPSLHISRWGAGSIRCDMIPACSNWHIAWACRISESSRLSTAAYMSSGGIRPSERRASTCQPHARINLKFLAS